MNAYLAFGEKSKAESQSNRVTCLQCNLSTEITFPESGWEDIRKAFSKAAVLPQFEFNMSHIVAYFGTRLARDSKAATDLKSINKSAEGLYKCGHVQSIQVSTDSQFIYIKSKCLPEMRKDRVYLLRVALKSEEYDVVLADCGCPASKGPHCSCKHIAALSYALADFSHST